MFKWILVVSLVVIISFLHLRINFISLETHLLHQELFFIPIVLASFWFRLRAGIVIAVIVSGIYLSSMLPHLDGLGMRATVFSQIALYFIIATLIGWLTSMLHRQQQGIIKDEQRNSLAKLTSALSSEIHEVVRSLEVKFKELNGQSAETGNLDIKQEIERLERLTNAFTQIDPPGSRDFISKDLNGLVKNTQQKYKKLAKSSQVNLKVELDDAGCPSMVITRAISQLLEALVVNAIEASPINSEVILRTTRKGSYCLLEVADEGPGVAKENIAKLFHPFFTTKPDGHGLSLAAGRKVIKDFEGDLLYEPGENGGAVFKIVVPRENREKNIDEFVSERVRQSDAQPHSTP